MFDLAQGELGCENVTVNTTLYNLSHDLHLEHKTFQRVVMYRQTKFSSKRIRSSENKNSHILII